MQNSIAMSIARPITTFKTKLQHIAWGTFKDAFPTSSVESSTSWIFGLKDFKVTYRRGPRNQSLQTD